MELALRQQTTIRDLKKQFSALFAFLKVEFFYEQTGKEQGLSSPPKTTYSTMVSAIKSMKKEHVFSFAPSTPVSEFEQRLQQELGLAVQVFRKASESWIETEPFDCLSLEKQNRIGEAASRPIRFNLNSLFF
jgi:hypothetical protein